MKELKKMTHILRNHGVCGNLIYCQCWRLPATGQSKETSPLRLHVALSVIVRAS